MSVASHVPREISKSELPAVPLTIEGASVLHQMFRFNRSAWRALSSNQKEEILSEAQATLEPMEKNPTGQSALFSLFGHKGDLLFIHFRNSFVELKEAELKVQNLRLNEYLESTTSYLSMVELGLYESTVKTYGSLAERGIEPHSPEWKTEVEEVLARQKEAMHERLYPQVPDTEYVCFYPMDRKRGEGKNWYTLPLAERQRQMHEHGLVGRRYAGEVRQIITGSIGFDDWEWGVDLFADDPLTFKKLIYEMRFDEVSAVYALFGTFYVGLRCPAASLCKLLEGSLP
jgi:hydrogen peroxide-dependent heme synthase